MYFINEDILNKISKEPKKDKILSITDKMNDSLIKLILLKEKLLEFNKYSFLIENGKLINYTKQDDYKALEKMLNDETENLTKLKHQILTIKYDDLSLGFVIINECSRVLLNTDKIKEKTRVK